MAPACIELQDQAGVDVNILFFLLWNATQSRTLDNAEVAELERSIGAWRDMAVVPIRNVRRALKSPPPVMSAGRRRGLPHPHQGGGARGRAAAAGGDVSGWRNPARSAAPRHRRSRPPGPASRPIRPPCGRSRPGPLETILAAFAKFEPPGRDRADRRTEATGRERSMNSQDSAAARGRHFRRVRRDLRHPHSGAAEEDRHRDPSGDEQVGGDDAGLRDRLEGEGRQGARLGQSSDRRHRRLDLVRLVRHDGHDRRALLDQDHERDRNRRDLVAGVARRRRGAQGKAPPGARRCARRRCMSGTCGR